MKLERPLIVFDLETTGVDTSEDRIVEISMVKIMPNGDQEVKTRRVNPMYSISAEATEVHGIKIEDVENEPTFSSMAKSMVEYMSGCDLAGYNIMRFDLPLLVEEFLRAGINTFPEPDVKFIDAFKIYTMNNPRNLTAAYKQYCDKDLDDAHSAEADTLATAEILMEQIKVHEEVPEDVAGIDEYCREGREIVDYNGSISKDEEGEYIFTFGKHKDKRIMDNLSYAEWMLKNNFPRDTKNKLRSIIY